MTQDEPIMDGGVQADREARIAGIVEQMRADMQLLPLEDSERVLRQRLGDSGIDATDEEISRIARDVQGGPSVVD
ncbi:hypothetical protein ABCS02_16740 [Microbacterium sp. X-17]|uniref:hypothetical protein n=1 Tax=Microbacterium sp. X-17 TaxID=3144404 RepID=UPI0031F5B878